MLSTTELHYLEGPYGKHRIGHESGYAWGAIVEAVAEIFECDESEIGCLEGDSDEGRDFDQVTVRGKPVANIISTKPQTIFTQSNPLKIAAE